MKTSLNKTFYLLIYLLPFCLGAQYYKAATYNNGGESLPYRFLLPENYSSEKEYPLIIFLHGAGERGDDNELQLFHGSDLFLDKKFREKYPAIVVFPQCPLEGYWATILDRPESLKFEYSENPLTDKIGRAHV